MADDEPNNPITDEVLMHQIQAKEIMAVVKAKINDTEFMDVLTITLASSPQMLLFFSTLINQFDNINIARDIGVARTLTDQTTDLSLDHKSTDAEIDDNDSDLQLALEMSRRVQPHPIDTINAENLCVTLNNSRNVDEVTRPTDAIARSIGSTEHHRDISESINNDDDFIFYDDEDDLIVYDNDN